MIKAKKRGNSWHCLVYLGKDRNGKRKYASITADTKRECELLAGQRKQGFEEKEEIDITVSECIKEYIENKRVVLSPSTVRTYETTLKNNYEVLGYKNIGKLTDNDIQKWINNLYLNGVKVKSIKNAKALMYSALKMYGIDTNFNINLPQGYVVKYRVPTDEELQKIIDYFKERNNQNMIVAVYLSAFGTLRRGEICALTSDDVVGDCVIINKSLVVNEDYQEVIKPPKTNSSNRIVKLPQFVIDLLPENGRLVDMTLTAITHAFYKCANDLGLTGMRFHDLRHYSASIMHAIGVPDSYIMQRGGWSSDNTLKKVYRNTLTDYEDKFSETTVNYFDKFK